MNITLRQIRAFVAAAVHGRFVLAAQNVHVTQSALSMLIRDLEKEMGVRLFDRHTRMLQLTEAGREFLPVAQKTLDDLEAALATSRDRVDLKRGRVAIASSTVLGATLLPWAIGCFSARYPGIRMVLRDVPEQEIAHLVKTGAVDLGVGTALDPDADLAESPLFDDRLMLLCAQNHALATRRTVAWRDLAAYPLIMLQPGSPLRQIVDRSLATAGVRVVPAFEVAFSSTAISMVAAGLGIAPLPLNAREVSPKVRVKSLALEQPIVPRRVAVFTRRETRPTPAAAAFRQFLADYLSKGATRTGLA